MKTQCRETCTDHKLVRATEFSSKNPPQINGRHISRAVIRRRSSSAASWVARASLYEGEGGVGESCRGGAPEAGLGRGIFSIKRSGRDIEFQSSK